MKINEEALFLNIILSAVLVYKICCRFSFLEAQTDENIIYFPLVYLRFKFYVFVFSSVAFILRSNIFMNIISS